MELENEWYDPRYKNAHTQKIRYWRLVKARFACERCGRKTDLRLHHLTYERFGNERLDDVQIVCSVCHPSADDERRQKEHAERNMKRMLRRK
jgi:hypothetical protein